LWVAHFEGRTHAEGVLECRVLNRIFGRKSDGVKGEQKRRHIEEFYDFTLSRNVIRVIKTGRLGEREKVARME
jgi:predicted DNA-binding protein